MLTPLVERSRMATVGFVNHYVSNCQGGGYWQPMVELNCNTEDFEPVECIKKVFFIMKSDLC